MCGLLHAGHVSDGATLLHCSTVWLYRLYFSCLQGLIDGLGSLAARHLPPAAVPPQYVFVDHLPRSAAGKLLRQKLPQPTNAYTPDVQAAAYPASGIWEAPPAASTQTAVQQGSTSQEPQHAQLAAIPLAHQHIHREPESSHTSQHQVIGAQQVHPRIVAPGEARVMSVLMQALHGKQDIDLSFAPFEPASNLFVHGFNSIMVAAAAAELNIDPRLMYANPTARSLVQFLRSTIAGSSQQGMLHRHQGEQLHSDLSNPQPITAHVPAITGNCINTQNDGNVKQEHNTVNELPAFKRRRLKHETLQLPPASTGQASCTSSSQPTAQATAPPAISDLLNAATHYVLLSACNKYRTGRLRSAQLEQQSADTQPSNLQLRVVHQDTTQPASSSTTQPQPVAANSKQRPQSVLHSTAGHSLDEEQPVSITISLQSRVRLGLCVDAPPLVLALLNSTDIMSTAASSRRLITFACSHSGDVAAVLMPAGTVLWHTQLPSRADVGMTADHQLLYIAVPCGDSKLRVLNVADGSIAGVVDCAGECKAAPVTDPSEGLWWMTTHAGELLLIQPPATVVLR